MSIINKVEEMLKLKRLSNIEEVRQNVNKSDVQVKIKKHCEKFDGIFTCEDIKNQILSNDLVASMFAKDPLRQNLTEPFIASLMKDNVNNFILLPKSGRNAIRFDDAKSVDFVFDKDGVKYYATQKYTREAGGAQDNQKVEVKHFLNVVRKHMKENEKAVAILDGAYWENGNRKELADLFKECDNIIIASVENFMEV